MKFKNFTLDDFQEDAVKAVDRNESVMVSAPTGSGKTLIADYIIAKVLKTGKRVVYTAPIKALSNQKYKDFVEDHGEEKIGLVTGDIVINSDAQALIMTTEVYRNMAVIGDPILKDVAYCIMDEIHYINDEERGYVWEESIIFSPEHVRYLFLSATVPNAAEFAGWVSKIKNHKVAVIETDYRPVPLKLMFYDVNLGITTLKKIKEQKELDSYPDYGSIYGRKKKKRMQPPDFVDVIKELRGRLPCIYFVFSRAKTQQYASKLAKKDFLNPSEKKEVAEIVQKEFRKCSSDVLSLKSTLQLRECLAKGIGFHHAGMLPDMKHVVEKLFGRGLVKVLFATETFAVGINMPAKTVCFDSLRKYTGTGFRFLNSKEFYQISGRAGRRGMDKEGLSVSVIHRPSLDFRKVSDYLKGDTLAIKSQFKLSYNTVLNMINLHNQDEIDKILMRNFHVHQTRKAIFTIKARFAKAVKRLTKLGYVKDGGLTEMGQFTTRIYSNELELSQLMLNFRDLDEYEMLMCICAISFENKKELRFKDIFPTPKLNTLMNDLREHDYLRRSKWIGFMPKLTGIVNLIYDQRKFVDILKNSNMVEGDLMRILMQMLDRLEQVDRALTDDTKVHVIRNCKHLIRDNLEGIGFV